MGIRWVSDIVTAQSTRHMHYGCQMGVRWVSDDTGTRVGAVGIEGSAPTGIVAPITAGRAGVPVEYSQRDVGIVTAQIGVG